MGSLPHRQLATLGTGAGIALQMGPEREARPQPNQRADTVAPVKCMEAGNAGMSRVQHLAPGGGANHAGDVGRRPGCDCSSLPDDCDFGLMAPVPLQASVCP